MRVLIVAAVLACAAAAPSGLLAGHGLIGHGSLGLAGAYAAAPLAIGHGAPLAIGHAAPLAIGHAVAPAAPTISPGDIQGAAIDAHVVASDHVRASVDAARELHDQASELQGQAINAAEDHSWQAVDAAKTVEAEWDGAAAGAAPILAKQLAGHVAPVVAAAPLVAAYGAPGILAGHAGLAGLAAPGLVAGHAAYAAPAIAASNTVVTQSLSQSHPAPVLHAAPLALGAYGAHAGIAHAGLAHGIAHGW